MYIAIPQRQNVPETEIYVKILKKNKSKMLLWDRAVIILIHGGPGGNHTLYADIEDDLLEIADLVLIDLRECGLSQKNGAEYCTFDNHTEDLKYILQKLNIFQPIFHGSSYGALVSLSFSIKYPEMLSKQILSSCVVSGEFIENAKENLAHIGTAQQIKAAENLWAGTFETIEQFTNFYSVLAPLYFFNYESVVQKPTATIKIPYNIEVINLAFKTFLRTFNFTNELALVKTKTLIFSGKNDWIFDSKQAEVLNKGINNSILIALDECGHFPWKDQKSLFLSHLNAFLFSDLNQNLEVPASSGSFSI